MRLAAVVLVSWLSQVPISSRANAQTPVVAPVTGVVFDSLTMRGLTGATVQIVSASDASWSRSVATDTLGRFDLGPVPAGTYVLGYFHAKLDSLALTSPTLRVDVRTPRPVNVRLAVPSARAIASSLCGRRTVRDSTGLLMGYLRGADDMLPRVNGVVTVRWSEIVIEKTSIRRHVPAVDASSGATGLVAVCGIPLGTPVLLQAASANDSSGAFEVTMPSSGFLHRDVYVAPLTRTTVAATDSTPEMSLLRGDARLRGRVVAVTGRAIPDARVMVWGTGVETRTNEDGAFTLTGLPGGTHTLDVRAVGFSPVQRPVDILSGSPTADVELLNLGITLDTIRVMAQRVYTSRRLAAFERRLKSGFGHIIQEDEIARRNPMYVSDLLRTIPGVIVTPSRYSGDDVHMRAIYRGYCRPSIYIDGAPIINDPSFPLNNLVSTTEIRAMEVYTRSLTTPMEFQGISQSCGAIVIWTGPRRKR